VQSTLDRVPLQGVSFDLYGGKPRKFRFRATPPVEFDEGVRVDPPAERFRLANFRPVLGSWAAPFQDPKHPSSLQRLPFRSSALVYEDGELLPWIVSEAAMVGERPGSFYHAPKFVHFSPTDGSNPRTNGKTYEIAFPDLTGWLLT
jgi:hypothetical protein